ncbi:hypothetical protein [Planomonospora algeriensis]
MKTETGAPRRWTVLAVCCLSLFLVGLDTTAVNVGLPSIGDGLQVGTAGWNGRSTRTRWCWPAC